MDEKETERRKARLTEICAGLPEASATESGHGPYVTFRVRRKTFGWYLDGHQGDDRVSLWLKVTLDEQQALLGSDPERFFSVPYMGQHGWVGVRLDLPDIDWEEIAELATESYRLLAPKRLSDRLTL
ncbi:MmcQ/YjbR family DNA-binding protein [Actinomadura harenae]|nr:MmcQ/YjbR family DNA-binding protein [Actinomadura harenae]